jgi:hypothetical protein
VDRAYSLVDRENQEDGGHLLDDQEVPVDAEELTF